MYSVLNCQNVAKHTEFYLEYLRFKETFTGNVGCFKKELYSGIQMLLCGKCYETFVLTRLNIVPLV
jgi:hypothetical protein